MRKLFLLLFLIPNISSALPETLNQYMVKNPTWFSGDMASLSYITSRCGLLTLVISEQYKNQPGTQAHELYELTRTRAATFTVFSDAIYKANGGNTKGFQDRAKTWAKLYGEEGISNIQIYGTFIRGDIASDLTTCGEKVIPFIEAVLNDAN